MRPAPEFKVADAASVVAMGAAFVPPAPIENLKTDRLTPDQRTPRQVDVETLLAAAPAARETVAVSVLTAAPVAFPIAEAADDGRGWDGNLAWRPADGAGARLRLRLEPHPSGGRAVAR